MATWDILTWLSVIGLMIAAYLLGSIPSAVWIGKKYYGIDIREHGSKNAGTTNMLRVLGKRAAAPVFVIDYLKGYIAVLLTGLAPVSEAWDINLRLIATVAVAGDQQGRGEDHQHGQQQGQTTPCEKGRGFHSVFLSHISAIVHPDGYATGVQTLLSIDD